MLFWSPLLVPRWGVPSASSPLMVYRDPDLAITAICRLVWPRYSLCLAALTALTTTLSLATTCAVGDHAGTVPPGNRQQRTYSAYWAWDARCAVPPQLIALMDLHTRPLEAEMLADAADGRLDRHTLLSAALIASGIVDATALQRQEAVFRAALQRLHQRLADSHCLQQKAQAVFQFMHQELLFGGYALQTTDLGETLRSGKYNCLTATIVYNCLANEVGVPTCAVHAPGHVLSRIFLPDATLDVETTCPRWFQLSARPAEQAEQVTQIVGIAPNINNGTLREASDVELVAMLYYNRGCDLLAGSHFAEAAAANLKSLRLAPHNATAKGNLLATINNWAIELARQRQFAEAAHLLRLGMDIEPSFHTFMANYVHLHQQWTSQLCQQGRTDEALGLLQQQAAAFPQEPFFARAAAELQGRQRWPAMHTQPQPAQLSSSPLPAALKVPTSASDPNIPPPQEQ